MYYRLPGLLADLALIIYALITYALFRLIPVTLTLPGIAGFVLSIGMAVDANILIFERLKEELLAGRTLKQAVDLGWKRAWSSIRDSNISTLITCCDPLLVRQHIWRQPGEGLLTYPRPWCVSQYVHRYHCYQDILAHHAG